MQRPEHRQAIEAIQAELNYELTDYTPATDDTHHNVHYRGGPPAGGGVFVKLVDKDAYYNAEVWAASTLSQTSPGFPTPRLLAHGRATNGVPWLAYEWHDFRPFTPTAANIEAAGRTLGTLHEIAVTADLEPPRLYSDLTLLTRAKIDSVRVMEPALAGRLDQLAGPLLREWHPPERRPGLVHGDVGWRNFQLGQDDGVWLIDFEHCAEGDPVLDFAKLLDRELADPRVREVFLGGYATANRSVDIDLSSTRLVRLWAAAGIFPYARAHRDTDFEAHAFKILERLERETYGG